MFLISELCTQQAQHALSLSREKALFVGSACSGYLTGFGASLFEWQKVQRGAASAIAATARSSPILSRRVSIMHGAGLRNAVFDSTFFGSEYQARTRLGLPPAVSYGCAAALAVTIDYPLDVAVKNLMAAPVHEPAPPGGALGLLASIVRDRRLLIFAGLGAKCAEFALSYGVTGWSSTYVRSALGA